MAYNEQRLGKSAGYLHTESRAHREGAPAAHQRETELFELAQVLYAQQSLDTLTDKTGAVWHVQRITGREGTFTIKLLQKMGEHGTTPRSPSVSLTVSMDGLQSITIEHSPLRGIPDGAVNFSRQDDVSLLYRVRAVAELWKYFVYFQQGNVTEFQSRRAELLQGTEKQLAAFRRLILIGAPMCEILRNDQLLTLRDRNGNGVQLFALANEKEGEQFLAFRNETTDCRLWLRGDDDYHIVVTNLRDKPDQVFARQSGSKGGEAPITDPTEKANMLRNMYWQFFGLMPKSALNPEAEVAVTSGLPIATESHFTQMSDNPREFPYFAARFSAARTQERLLRERGRVGVKGAERDKRTPTKENNAFCDEIQEGLRLQKTDLLAYTYLLEQISGYVFSRVFRDLSIFTEDRFQLALSLHAKRYFNSVESAISLHRHLIEGFSNLHTTGSLSNELEKLMQVDFFYGYLHGIVPTLEAYEYALTLSRVGGPSISSKVSDGISNDLLFIMNRMRKYWATLDKDSHLKPAVGKLLDEGYGVILNHICTEWLDATSMSGYLQKVFTVLNEETVKLNHREIVSSASLAESATTLDALAQTVVRAPKPAYLIDTKGDQWVATANLLNHDTFRISIDGQGQGCIDLDLVSGSVGTIRITNMERHGFADAVIDARSTLPADQLRLKELLAQLVAMFEPSFKLQRNKKAQPGMAELLQQRREKLASPEKMREDFMKLAVLLRMVCEWGEPGAHIVLHDAAGYQVKLYVPREGSRDLIFETITHRIFVHCRDVGFTVSVGPIDHDAPRIGLSNGVAISSEDRPHEAVELLSLAHWLVFGSITESALLPSAEQSLDTRRVQRLVPAFTSLEHQAEPVDLFIQEVITLIRADADVVTELPQMVAEQLARKVEENYREFTPEARLSMGLLLHKHILQDRIVRLQHDITENDKRRDQPPFMHSENLEGRKRRNEIRADLLARSTDFIEANYDRDGQSLTETVRVVVQIVEQLQVKLYDAFVSETKIMDSIGDSFTEETLLETAKLLNQANNV